MVGPSPAAVEAPGAGGLPWEVERCADPSAARLDQGVAVVLAAFRLPGGGTALPLLREARDRCPGARRVLLAAHDDLPDLLAAAGPGLVDKVLPLGARPEKVRKALAELLSPDEVSVSVSRARGLDWMAAEELLRWTAVRFTRAKGVVLRALPKERGVLQQQFVLLQARRNEQLRQDLLAQWLWPLKPRGAAPARKDRGHPVLRRLGRLTEEAEVYARQVGKQDAWVWVALLPWRREPRLTAVLGVEVPAGPPRPELRALLEEVHRRALDEVTDFPLPDLGAGEEASGVGQPLLEYDWVATPDYVGPDRRRAPTTFLNRYVLVGRRKRVPSRLRHLTESFADRFSADVWWYLAAFVPLALLDTALTWVHVRSGAVREMNPLLRPLVLHAPWAFVAAKNAIALGAFFVVARFRLFRLGLSFLRLTVGLYLLLDLYWLALLAWPR